jgi:membrane dipeptidase
MNRAVMTPESYSEVWTYPKDFESISELPNFVRGLIKRGWSTGEIRKVLGENWLRVYKQVWGV